MAKSLAQKMFMKEGYRIRIINEIAGLRAQLGELPAGVTEAKDAKSDCDFVLAFAKEIKELAKVAPLAVKSVRHDGVLWVCYPKKSGSIKSDIMRDQGWDALKSAGLQAVSQVAIDDDWSALRFRPVK